MLDHLLYQRTKWYPIGTKISIPANTEIIALSGVSNEEGSISFSYKQDHLGKAYTISTVGTIILSGQLNYAFTGTFVNDFGHSDTANTIWLVPASSVTVLGGVISSLICRLIAACRRVAIAW